MMFKKKWHVFVVYMPKKEQNKKIFTLSKADDSQGARLHVMVG